LFCCNYIFVLLENGVYIIGGKQKEGRIMTDKNKGVETLLKTATVVLLVLAVTLFILLFGGIARPRFAEGAPMFDPGANELTAPSLNHPVTRGEVAAVLGVGLLIVMFIKAKSGKKGDGFPGDRDARTSDSESAGDEVFLTLSHKQPEERKRRKEAKVNDYPIRKKEKWDGVERRKPLSPPVDGGALTIHYVDK
jgi:hypothetical protein